MNFERTKPRDGEVKLTGLTEGEYRAFVSIMKWYVRYNGNIPADGTEVTFAKNVLAGMGEQ